MISILLPDPSTASLPIKLKDEFIMSTSEKSESIASFNILLKSEFLIIMFFDLKKLM